MRIARNGLALGYLLVLGVGFSLPWLPRVFWTVVMPLVPIGVVLFGFHAWRRACPIATMGTLGARLHRSQRRLPVAWRRLGLVAPMAILIGCLVSRLVGVNGDSTALVLFLGSLGAGAFVFNAFFGGRTFCHHVCPVGVVERIYTDGASALSGNEADSGCGTCTGCTKGCADIDRDRAYVRTVENTGRRGVTYAFPGVVFGFYFHYYLRSGSWEAYFDGRWTEVPWTAELWRAPGYFFAPQVPDVAAASITLLTCAVLSWGVFACVERLLIRRIPNTRRRRHRVLALASFAAFNIFYIFAGAPALRSSPALSRVVAFGVPVIATLLLMHRLLRSDFRSEGQEKKKIRLPVVGA